MGAYALVPGFAPSVVVGAELQPVRRLHVALTGLFVPERRTEDGRFGFAMWALGAGACYDALVRRWIELAPCADVLGGQTLAKVYTLQALPPGDRPWIGARVKLRLRVKIVGPLFADASAGGFVPFLRYKFDVVGESGIVFQEAPVVPAIDLGFGVRFP
jgi:hypothetical protein